MSWRHLSVAELGLDWPCLAGSEVRSGERGGAHYLVQTSEAASLALWWGEGCTLEAWRARLSREGNAEITPARAVGYCGAPAEERSALIRGLGMIEAWYRGADGALEARPQLDPDIYIRVVGMVRQNVAALVSFSVPAARREQAAALEREFFSRARAG